MASATFISPFVRGHVTLGQVGAGGADVDRPGIAWEIPAPDPVDAVLIVTFGYLP